MPPQSSGGQAFFPSRQTAYSFKADDAQPGLSRLGLIFRVPLNETQAQSRFGTRTWNIQELGILQSIFRSASRRETLGKHLKGGRRDGGLKMDWTKPLPRAWPMCIECRLDLG